MTETSVRSLFFLMHFLNKLFWQRIYCVFTLFPWVSFLYRLNVNCVPINPFKIPMCKLRLWYLHPIHKLPPEYFHPMLKLPLECFHPMHKLRLEYFHPIRKLRPKKVVFYRHFLNCLLSENGSPNTTSYFVVKLACDFNLYRS